MQEGKEKGKDVLQVAAAAAVPVVKSLFNCMISFEPVEAAMEKAACERFMKVPR